MTIDAPVGAPRRRARRDLVALGCLVAVTAGASYAVGTRHSGNLYEEAVCGSARMTISCELSDWTIAVPTDVPWRSADGTFHDGGRPRCLPPTGRGEVGPVGLTWVPADVDGMRWRSVVAVTCLD